MSIYEYSGVRLTQAHGHEVVAAGGEALQPGLAVPDHPRDVPGLHPRPDQLGQLQLADAAQDLIGRERVGRGFDARPRPPYRRGLSLSFVFSVKYFLLVPVGGYFSQYLLVDTGVYSQ